MVSKYDMASKRFLLGCCVNVKSSQASQASKLHARLQLVPGNKLRPSRLVTSRRHEMRRDESADGMSTRTKKSARFARREPIFLAPQGQRRQGGEERKWQDSEEVLEIFPESSRLREIFAQVFHKIWMTFLQVV